MHKLTVLFILAFVLNISVQAKEAYKINVKVNGIKDTVCYLAYYYGDKQYVKDTVKVNSKGEFVYAGNEPLPGGIYLVVMPNKNYFEIIVDKVQFFSIETDTSDFITKSTFKNSQDNSLFYKYLNFIQNKNKEITPLRTLLQKTKDKDSTESLRKQINKINEEVVNYKKEYMKQNASTLLATIFKASEEITVPDPPVLPNGAIDSTFQFRYYKAHYWDNINLTDDRILRTPIFFQKFSYYLEKVMHPSPDSIIVEVDQIIAKADTNKEMFKFMVWYITNEYAQSKIMGYDAVYVHMVKTYYMTNKAFWVTPSQLTAINERAMKVEPLLIGKTAPDISLTTLTGQQLRLHQLDAKYTILAFWSPDCGHCKTELPLLHKVYQKYKSKGVLTYIVPTMRDTAQVMKFIREKDMFDWINVLDILHDSNFRAEYDIYATPQIYLLDDKKKIIAKKLGPDQMDNLLEKLLEEKAGQKPAKP